MQLTDMIELDRVIIARETKDLYRVCYGSKEYDILKRTETLFVAPLKTMGLEQQLTQTLGEEIIQTGIFQDKKVPTEFKEIMMFHILRKQWYQTELGIDPLHAHQLTLHDEFLYTFKFFEPEHALAYFQFAIEYRKKHFSSGIDSGQLGVFPVSSALGNSSQEMVSFHRIELPSLKKNVFLYCNINENEGIWFRSLEREGIVSYEAVITAVQTGIFDFIHQGRELSSYGSKPLSFHRAVVSLQKKEFQTLLAIKLQDEFKLDRSVIYVDDTVQTLELLEDHSHLIKVNANQYSVLSHLVARIVSCYARFNTDDMK